MTNLVSVRGTIYPSQKAAAEALGVSHTSISKALAKRGHCDNVGLHGKHKLGRATGKKPVQIGAYNFPSIREAALALSIGDHIIRAHMNDCLAPVQKERLLAAIMRYSVANPVSSRRLTATPKGS